MMWVVKTAKGNLIISSARETRTAAIEAYIGASLKSGQMKPRPEWFGLGYYVKCWQVLRRNGFKAVQVTMTMHSDGNGFSWPECTEVKS